jgi:hypothetical protein
MPEIIGKKEQKLEITPDMFDKKKNQELMLELGREIDKLIQDFFLKKQLDGEMIIVVGALDYIIRYYKERRNALGNKYLMLLDAVRPIDVHEPLTDDNIRSAPDFLDVSK